MPAIKASGKGGAATASPKKAAKSVPKKKSGGGKKQVRAQDAPGASFASSTDSSSSYIQADPELSEPSQRFLASGDPFLNKLEAAEKRDSQIAA
eukprot:CAMPEP_0115862698 /NCGR_PEP_ID=MMETSP0287-20121206/18311_1 /TAXON_ID=412157 /ORGANISM="Chrysochromulina rotalis, Strain UIO044" /LENGTH=93 /DNA_ID=CAMNT_0003317129 /DNA_START=53 /DNA_END=337 /DNA_ORIENTATION=-